MIDLDIDLDAIRKRDRDYDDVFEAQASMSKDIAHRLVAWPVADRRALLAYVDALAARLADAERERNALRELLREARNDYAHAAMHDAQTASALGCNVAELGVKLRTLLNKIARIDAALERQP